MNVVWTKLQTTATAGSSTITVMDSVTGGPKRPWKAGDKIVIATTGHFTSQRENEIHTILSVAANGVDITLVEPLQYSHLGTTETIGGHVLEYRAEVGLLTRNILLRGLRDPQWSDVIEECAAGFNPGMQNSSTF